jgi:hypothetical protein
MDDSVIKLRTVISQLSNERTANAAKERLTAERMRAEVEELLLSGAAQSASEAEHQFLDAHLDEITDLIGELSEEEIRDNEIVQLLMSHGSRPWEDSLW